MEWCINRRKERALIFAIEKEQDLGYGSGKKVKGGGLWSGVSIEERRERLPLR